MDAEVTSKITEFTKTFSQKLTEKFTFYDEELNRMDGTINSTISEALVEVAQIKK
jgi:hypothetical protein